MKNLAIVIGFILVAYWQLFLPLLHVANDLPASSPEIVSSFLTPPNAYSSIDSPFGANKIATLWSWPYNFSYGFLQTIGFNRNLQIILLGITPILFFATLGIWKISQLLKLSELGRMTAIIVYLLNSYILLLIDGGQLLWALAYSFFPLCFYVFEKEHKSEKPNSFKVAFVLVALGFFDIRAVLIFLLIIAIRVITDLLFSRGETLLQWFHFGLKSAATYILVFTSLNMYWLLPSIMMKGQTIPANFSASLNSDFANFTQLIHGLLLFQPHWFKNIYGEISLPSPYFVIFPICAFAAPLLRKRDKSIAFLLITTFVGVFLVKGNQPPFGFIFDLLFNLVPGFFIFRDPTKFFILIALAYSLLIGISITELERVFKRFKPAIGIIALIIFLLAGPVMLGKTTGLFSPVTETNDFLHLENSLKNESQRSKVLWVPNKPPAGFSDMNHLAVNAVDLTSIRPFASGIRGTYETLNFLREASAAGELLDISGIGYLAYSPPDPKKKYKKDQIEYQKTFLNQLKNRKWIDYQISESQIPLFKTKSTQPTFFVTQNTAFVVGPDTLYGESTKSGDLKLSNNALIFVDEQTGLISEIDNFPNAKIILNQTNGIDLAALHIPADNLIFPSRNLTKDPDVSGWWKRDSSDLLNWKDFLLQKYQLSNQDFELGGGWAVAEGELTLNLKIPFKTKGQLLLARALNSSSSGEIAFFENNNPLGFTKTKSSKDGFHWSEIGQFKSDNIEVQIKTTGDINIINALAIVEPESWKKYKSKVEKYISENKIIKFSDSDKALNLAKVSYRKINESKYLVTISNLKTPATLVFSQIYDPKWDFNGRSPVKVYSFLNGFPVDNNGVFVLEYKPQRWVEIGFIVSLFSAVGWVVFVVFPKFKK